MVEAAITANRSSSELEVIPIGANIGAELRGIKLSGDLAPELVKDIRAAVMTHKVVFFRDQHHLDDAGQTAFTELFGELQKPIAKSADNSPGVLELTGGYHTAAWHADMTFMPDPLAFTILRSVQLPPIGGDTMWANAAAAYRSLPAPLKLLAENLWSIQSSDFDLEGAYNEDIRARIAKPREGDSNYARQQLIVRTEHPVVLVHPETGERSLLVGPDVKRFVGMNNADSAKILEILQSYVTMPENTVRWSWRLGDVAMWDNRTTQHRSVPDHGDGQRVLRRTALRGTVLTGIDGRQSRRLDD
jgi:alpha-ketoglutarate-dependent sulfate ester dioxygenase